MRAFNVERRVFFCFLGKETMTDQCLVDSFTFCYTVCHTEHGLFVCSNEHLIMGNGLGEHKMFFYELRSAGSMVVL